MQLMAYADGELDEPSRREVEALLATDDEALRFVEQLTNLSALVVDGHDERRAAAIDTFDIASAVMDAVRPEAAIAEVASPKSNVRSLDAARAKRSAGSSPFLKVGGGVAALALAASLMLFMQRTRQTTEVPMAAQNSASSETAAGDPGVAIDSPGESVSVFYLPTANELSTSVVVWVDETGEK
jgi:anti-sigma factor RsiW